MWCIQYEPERHVLTLRLTGAVSAAQMRGFVRAHAQGLAATGGDRFRVLVDLRGLTPLEKDAAAQLADASRAVAALPAFVSRTVLASSATVLMQQRMATTTQVGDLYTTDEAEALEHIARPV